MAIYQIDPLRDARWMELVERHPLASCFHTRGWLMALRESYGYEPCALSTTAPGKALEDGLVFCRVRSRLTGRRLVSLPFSDHAQPLASGEGLQELLTGFERERAAGAWRYAEVRPIVLDNTDISAGKGYGQGDRYFLHRLDLQPSLESLFSGFHKSCVQRAIKRAQKGEVRTKSGNAPELLRLFYRLMVQTRRRHRLPQLQRRPCPGRRGGTGTGAPASRRGRFHALRH